MVINREQSVIELRLKVHLRTVPTIFIAHAFCASRATRVFYEWCLLTQGYFFVVQNYAEIVLVSKKKVGCNHAFFRDN